MQFSYPTVKRMVDFLLSGFLLVALSPLLLTLAALCRVLIGSPVLFRQQRPGLLGQPFTLFKFRTMAERRDGYGALLPDEQRMTRFGTFLRSTSLDELPELVNILKGEMSFVGPRPLLMEYLTEYSPEQNRRHEVRPGLTGLAQVSGRNEASWDQRFEHDLYYVENFSPVVDFRIVLKTVGAVLARKDVSQSGHATMPKFGSK